MLVPSGSSIASAPPQPRTAHPPSISKQSTWCGVVQRGQAMRASGRTSLKQNGQTITTASALIVLPSFHSDDAAVWAARPEPERMDSSPDGRYANSVVSTSSPSPGTSGDPPGRIPRAQPVGNASTHQRAGSWLCLRSSTSRPWATSDRGTPSALLPVLPRGGATGPSSPGLLFTASVVSIRRMRATSPCSGRPRV